MNANSPLPPLAQIPPEIACLADYESFARARMSPEAWAYFNGGAGDEHTAGENLAAFVRRRLRNRVLRNFEQAHTRLELFGQTLDYPVLLAPVALQKLAHPEGELASALGAAALRAGMIVSAQSSVALEDLARAAQTVPPWFQLYIQPDRAFTRTLVRRAEAAGYRALVVTVDAPVHGTRNREQRAGFHLPAGIEAVNLKGMAGGEPALAPPGQSPLFGTGFLRHAATWRDIENLRAFTQLPLLLKGITCAEDATQALELGVDGLIVSNHGGRVLDTQPASIDLLPGVVAAVNGKVPVLCDGGIRRGTDVLKALALGACAVLIGRPYVYALAAAGAPGVAHVLHILRW